MTGINKTLFEFFYQWGGRDPLLDAFFVFLAKFLPYLLILSFVIWVLTRADWRIRWLLFAEGAMAVIFSRGIITETIRFFYYNPRPSAELNLATLISESSSSFPSGHAAFFFAMATVIFFYNRSLAWWFYGFALAVGVARITAGVHWPFDILGGAAVGVLSGFLVHKLLEPHSKQLFPREGALTT